MRIRYEIQMGVSSTTAEEKDLGNQNPSAVVDTYREGGTMRFRIPANTLLVNVHHPQVAAGSFVYLRACATDPLDTPAELLVRRNSTGAEAWPLTAIDGKEAHLLMSTSGLTALFVSNPGSVSMDVVATVCGD